MDLNMKACYKNLSEFFNEKLTPKEREDIITYLGSEERLCFDIIEFLKHDKHKKHGFARLMHETERKSLNQRIKEYIKLKE